MFGIGHFSELLMVVIILLLVFGPKRLPEMGNGLGKTIKEFQKSMREVTAHATTMSEEQPGLVPTVAEVSQPDPKARQRP